MKRIKENINQQLKEVVTQHIIINGLDEYLVWFPKSGPRAGRRRHQPSTRQVRVSAEDDPG